MYSYCANFEWAKLCLEWKKTDRDRKFHLRAEDRRGSRPGMSNDDAVHWNQQSELVVSC